MADLVGGRLADREVGAILGGILCRVGLQNLSLMGRRRLALVESNDGRDARVICATHALGVELLIIVAEHVEVERGGDARQKILQDAVHVIATDAEKVEVLARTARTRPFLGEALQIGEGERLKALRWCEPWISSS